MQSQKDHLEAHREHPGPTLPVCAWCNNTGRIGDDIPCTSCEQGKRLAGSIEANRLQAGGLK